MSTERPPVFSSDGAYVEVGVEWFGRRKIGQNDSGGRVTFPEIAEAGFSGWVKGTHDTDPRRLSDVVRASMKEALGSAPVVMVPAIYSGRITFRWDVTKRVPISIPTEEELLETLAGAISNAKIRKSGSFEEPEESSQEHLLPDAPTGPPDWMDHSLEAAKSIVKAFHRSCTCDTESFFRNATYDVYIQKDQWYAYAYITLRKGSNHFPIGVHPVLTEAVPWKQRALVVVFIHELLHALHPEWGHERVNPEQRLLANKGGYADGLLELVRLWVNGKMLSCGN